MEKLTILVFDFYSVAWHTVGNAIAKFEFLGIKRDNKIVIGFFGNGEPIKKDISIPADTGKEEFQEIANDLIKRFYAGEFQ